MTEETGTTTGRYPEDAGAGERRPSRRRRLGRRAALGAVGIAFIAATFAYFLPQIADYRDVWDVVRELSWPWLAALVAAAALNVLTFAPPWQVTLPGLGLRAAIALTQASATLSTILPGGAAVGGAASYRMLRSLGYDRRDVGRAVALIGLWNQFATLAYPIVAVFLLTAYGGDSALLATAAFVGVAILGIAVAALALVLWSSRMATDLGDVAARLASWARRQARRGPVAWGGASVEHFRRDAVGLLRRRWHVLTVATLLGSLSVFLVLVISLRALDVPSSQVTLVEAFAAWALVRLLTSVPVTPGGVGVIELGLTGALVGFGGNNAGVVAAVLVYRFLTLVPTLVLGLLAAATWRRHRR